ncbi:translation initiation factor eIF3 core subunit C [Saccharomycopsis crataegensis]|uniref:Eukaryotic translation initiation factor 3 subunit C n=1 Tax=Saccharomycopsis crataegensis TaxID=43959 RepID=A0AAV5QDJ2_9ASCO|nr:translation initiation factor eIF3 core subunit C [Saccharomycopsis crataegensis]
MSSRFFAASLSDSESDEELLSSEEEELLSSSEDEQMESSSEEDDDLDDDMDEDESDEDDDEPTGRNKFLKTETPQRSAAYFLKGSNIPDSDDETESESDDDNKKVVKSAKDKLLEEMKNSANEIDNAADFDDWLTVSKEFDKLNKLLIRSQQQNIPTPTFYIKTLAELEDVIILVSKENTKMNAVTSKAFNSIKQRVKRSSRDFEDLIKRFRESPEDMQKSATVPAVAPAGRSAAADEEELDIAATLRTVIENRGKKNVDRYEQVATLEKLLQFAESPFQFISIYFLLIPTRFDLSMNANYMPIDQWKNAEKNISALLTILEDNHDKYRVTENGEAGLDFENEPQANKDGIVEVLGSIASFVERLDDELTRSLLVIDPHSSDYIVRLRDESQMYNLILRAQLYVESLSSADQLTNPSNDQLFRIILRRIDHVYFKPIQLINFNEKTAWNALKDGQESFVVKSTSTYDKEYADGLVNTLCSVLYRQSNSVYRKKAMLCHIYYYAFNNQYFKARDMLLMSHLQSTIHSCEPAMQVLFNRTLVQLGLCAFKVGLIDEAFQTLQEIATSSRQKELLGQGVQRYNQQSSTTSVAADRQRLLPFHMHINLELLEAVFLTSSLLIEIPQAAQTGNNNYNKKASTKSFRRALEFHERQFFQGPPENTKDYIMYAAKSLQMGDWKKATNYIKSVDIWKLFVNGDAIKKMIEEKLQIEGLRTYLFQFRNYYTKLSIGKLAEIFELKESKVSAVLSKMIFKEEILAALDQKTSSVYFIHGHELNKPQELALVLAEKVGQLAEKNERLAAGGHQQQSTGFNSQSHGSNGNTSRNHHSQNFKISSSNSGIIAGALNGMDNKGNNRRQKRNNK